MSGLGGPLALCGGILIAATGGLCGFWVIAGDIGQVNTTSMIEDALAVAIIGGGQIAFGVILARWGLRQMDRSDEEL